MSELPPLKRYHCTCWKGGMEQFSVTAEHESSSQALRLAFLPPDMDGQVPRDALLYNYRGFTYTAEEY